MFQTYLRPSPVQLVFPHIGSCTFVCHNFRMCCFLSELPGSHRFIIKTTLHLYFICFWVNWPVSLQQLLAILWLRVHWGRDLHFHCLGHVIPLICLCSLQMVWCTERQTCSPECYFAGTPTSTQKIRESGNVVWKFKKAIFWRVQAIRPVSVGHPANNECFPLRCAVDKHWCQEKWWLVEAGPSRQVVFSFHKKGALGELLALDSVVLTWRGLQDDWTHVGRLKGVYIDWRLAYGPEERSSTVVQFSSQHLCIVKQLRMVTRIQIYWCLPCEQLVPLR